MQLFLERNKMPRYRPTVIIPKNFKQLCPNCAERLRLKIGGATKGVCEKCGSMDSHRVIYPGGNR